jgi:alpha-galactosidase
VCAASAEKHGIPVALHRTGFSQHGLEGYASPGHGNDPDCLLLGWLSNLKGGTAPTLLTPNEQCTHMSLWCLLAATLLLGGDITRLDEFTPNVLTNDEVLEIDQDSLGRQGHCVARPGNGVAVEVWAKPLEDGSAAVGRFDRDESEVTITVK